jgi:hypothetical protein
MAVLTRNLYSILSGSSKSLATITVSGHSTKVRAGNVGFLLRWVAAQIHGEVESITTLYGWRDRETNTRVGGDPRSNHMSGTALDINGARHPYERTRPIGWSSGFTTHETADIRRILEAAGGTVRWGLDFNRGYRDAMHFEVRGDALTLRRVARKLSGGKVKTTDVVNGRSAPSTKAPVKFVRDKGFPITYVAVLYRGGRLWLKTEYGTYYAAEFTTY